MHLTPAVDFPVGGGCLRPRFFRERKCRPEIRHRWAFQTVLPGHGLPGGPDIIDETDAYIAQFIGLQASGVDAVQAKRAMLDAYSDYLFMEALDASVSANFRG